MACRNEGEFDPEKGGEDEERMGGLIKGKESWVVKSKDDGSSRERGSEKERQKRRMLSKSDHGSLKHQRGLR